MQNPNTVNLGEDGYACWLRYAQRDVQPELRALVSSAAVTTGGPIMESARAELARGIRGICGVTPSFSKSPPKKGGLVLGTMDSMRRAGIAVPETAAGLTPEGFIMKASGEGEGILVRFNGESARARRATRPGGVTCLRP